MTAQWQNSRNLRERIIVTGILRLETPTHLGNGDADGLLDMPLHLDALSGSKALLSGTSIAGALRNYVREYAPDLVEQLFGTVINEKSKQSLVFVDDALGEAPIVELRDGVSIDPKTRSAEDKKKFDMELLAAGTEFKLSFELLLRKDQNAEQLLGVFVRALQALEEGEICLGKRKRRGFGRCSVYDWQVQRFDMTTAAGMIGWLNFDTDQPSTATASNHIISLFPNVSPIQAQRKQCTLNATFRLDGSLLIRSGFGEADAPDAVHLHSLRNGKDAPVLSGTSLAGVLRARALRIAKTLGKPGDRVVDAIFGYKPRANTDRTQLTASRLWVEETVIEQPLELVQSRLKIDRFTGGAYPGALFSEQPVFGQNETRVQLHLKLVEPQDAEIGLLLLLLKDLWTGDLPIGGESSVGRGRLSGECATLRGDGEWCIQAGAGNTLHIEGDRERLEQYVTAFVEKDYA